MAKRVILFAIICLGCLTTASLNESKATDTGTTSSSSDKTFKSRHHKYKPPYKILNSRYVTRSTINRSLANGTNGVRIKVLQNGMDNNEIEDFSVSYDSGNEYRMGNIFGVENSRLPLYVKVTYRSWNTFHAVQFDVTYEFMILYPGTWDVTLWN